MGGSRGHRLRVDDRHRMDFRDVVGLKLDASHDHRMNDLLVYRKMDVMTDASRDLRMSDRLDDRNLDDDRHDVLGDLRKNVMDDRNDLMMVVNLLNRNCALHDLNLGGTTDAMSHRVKYY